MNSRAKSTGKMDRKNIKRFKIQKSLGMNVLLVKKENTKLTISPSGDYELKKVIDWLLLTIKIQVKNNFIQMCKHTVYCK